MEEVTIKLPPLPEPPKGTRWERVSDPTFEAGDLVLCPSFEGNGFGVKWAPFEISRDFQNGVFKAGANIVGFVYRALPVVEQPAPAVIPIDDCFRILVNENGELYAIEKRANLHQAWCADNSNGSLAYAVVVAGLHAKNKRLDAECAEKDALIEKYRALAKSARAWLAFGQCSANNCETITTLLAEVENV